MEPGVSTRPTNSPPDAALVALERATLDELRHRVAEAAPRVAALGAWPQDLDPGALVSRLPEPRADGTITPGQGGFDAGVACCLDLIPRSVQALAAGLHAAYTPDRLAQVRAEIVHLDPDSATTWWLAACSICTEGPVTPEQFFDQCRRFELLRHNPEARQSAAAATLAEMRSSYEDRSGVAWALRDGGMQGAYIDGYRLAVQEATSYGLYFIGTYLASLGLEHFAWSQLADPDATDPAARLGRSGPVFGSRQFVKCADRDELDRALAAVQLSDEPE